MVNAAWLYRVEWRTLALILANYVAWALILFWVPVVVAVPLLAVVIAFQSSLTHEALHGHPFASARANAALMRLPLELFVPYDRFRATHLAHHRDSRLTDPYDDPESNFLDPADWARLPAWRRHLLTWNNTLAGRIFLGPLLGLIRFVAADWAAVRRGDGQVLRAWAVHGLGLAAVLVTIALSPLPLWAYLVANYAGLGVIRIRTFLEHRAHDNAQARTAIVESRGLLAFLYLNNSLHAVHHRHPNVPWYQLRRLYEADRAGFLEGNGHYVYRSYSEVFRAHFWRGKDPVAHPLWQREQLPR